MQREHLDAPRVGAGRVGEASNGVHAHRVMVVSYHSILIAIATLSSSAPIPSRRPRDRNQNSARPDAEKTV